MLTFCTAKNDSKQQGFNLLELLVVLGLIAFSESSIKYPQGVIGNSREARLPVSRKSGSGKLESDKKSVKKASKLSKR